MDIPIKFAVTKGVPLFWRGLGLRAAYRGIRVGLWQEADRRDPGGAAARNAARGARDKIRREWGGMWAAALPRALFPNMPGMPAVGALPPLTVVERMAQPFRVMEGRTPEELREHNLWAMKYGIYEPASQLIEQIRSGGLDANGMFSRLHRDLISDDIKMVYQAEASIIDLFAVNWHRAMQTAWFKEKIEVEWEIAKKIENSNKWKLLLQQWQKILHGYNDNTLPKILEDLMKLLKTFS